MSIQTDFAFTDIAIHQAELRREASQDRLSRRARTRPSLLQRLTRRRTGHQSDTASPGTDH